jgi:outer membrane protein assembly factor BamD (BamD/ComL family)
MHETEELAKVQAALASANPEDAISLLDSQDQLFRGGQLSEERDAARVLALCAANRVNEASRVRMRFEALHPMSPLLARVQRSCAK